MPDCSLLEASMFSQLNYPNEPIAIIGSACRFPGGVSSPSQLWELLQQPRDVLREIPQSRFNADKFYHTDSSHHGTSNVRHSYVLEDDHRKFDAHFFGISPVEAKAMDPQQRILLEVTYEALEAAGLPIKQLEGSSTGVFVGLMNEDFTSILHRDIQNTTNYSASGTARSILSNRISYFFDFRGPSMTIDTACSSSLVALHQAVVSLRTGESGYIAIVAGANLLLSPEPYIAESKLNMLSPSGRSHMWEKGADGYGRADGFGVLVLKTLSQALADHDSVDCIIRETGINQDGRTQGITMPSPDAQTRLIKTTYARAGLDPSKHSDRPQYFEAHGTGTAAGDPVEAQAISDTFFGSYPKCDGIHSGLPLYVGSVKTVIGHSEGAAGVAGVLKAVLAINHATIPPNVPLVELSPSVKPFYENLQILSEAIPWPKVSRGCPRRASINSFGFGGTNAHAILESFIDEPSISPQLQTSGFSSLAPFTFSAASEQSLLKTLGTFASYLENCSSNILSDLSWTLNTRRSTLASRVSVSALSKHELASNLLRISKTSDGIITAGAPLSRSIMNPRVLGIFTGQGAQWATMASDLIKCSPVARDCLEKLQKSLDSLPSNHAPTWSLKDELLRDSSSSRIGRANFSQPLCTAAQIIVLNLLRTANLKLSAVVGHSSGEIAAAHAAGYLSAEDAIRISYYRGSLFESDNASGQGMMAVQTSFDDALELCELPSLEGRIWVAAHNSPGSVTLSGCSNAIEEARQILDDEGKATRILRVDRAYHSPHMNPYAVVYAKALEQCEIQIQKQPRDETHPVWVSSVTGQEIHELSCLSSAYWIDNMVNTVKFSNAVEYAIGAHGPFNMAVEIGPHPALKRPTLDCIRRATGREIPYTGFLVRGRNDVLSFADAVGAIWMHLGPGVVDFGAFHRQGGNFHSSPPKLLKGLPLCSWDHERLYWHETRYDRAFRSRGSKPHAILGTLCTDATREEPRFRNYLSKREIPWLKDHQVRGQIIFPAAGYVSAVIDAIIQSSSGRNPSFIELYDVVIGQALLIPEAEGIEIMVSLKELETGAAFSDAIFTFYSSDGSNEMVVNASGKVRSFREISEQEWLPSPSQCTGQLQEVSAEKFYSFALDLGLGYHGPFRGLSEIRRKMNTASGLLAVPDCDKSFTIHPAALDCAIQAVLLAYCYPADDRMRSLHLPTRINRIRIDVSACQRFATSNAKLAFFSGISPQHSKDLVGDVDICSLSSNLTIIQLQGMHAMPLKSPGAEDDVKMFFETTWGPEIPYSTATSLCQYDSNVLSVSLERVAFFYLREISAAFVQMDRKEEYSHYQRLLDSTNINSSLEKNEDWRSDLAEDIDRIFQQYPEIIDLKVMKSLRTAIIKSIDGDKGALDPVNQYDLLSDFCRYGFGMSAYLKHVSCIIQQICHRFPHMRIMELGPGVGGVADAIIKKIGQAYKSYTCTAPSSSAVAKVQQEFARNDAKIDFKVFDIKEPLSRQDFRERSFDLLVVVLVLHTSADVAATLTQIRRLVRPGGFLIILEVVNMHSSRFNFLFGTLQDRPVGDVNTGTPLSFISVNNWEDTLHRAGFSIESFIPNDTYNHIPLSLFCCRALDNATTLLRSPLSPNIEPFCLDSVTIAGSLDSYHGVGENLRKHYTIVRHVPTTDFFVSTSSIGSIVSLVDLEEPLMFNETTTAKLEAIQAMFKQGRCILWVTVGARSTSPLSNMFLGVLRTVVLEMKHVRAQFLDFATKAEVDYRIIAERLLQLEIYVSLEEKDQLGDLLWYMEPEAFVEGGRVLLPRLRPSRMRNQRLSSAHKRLTHCINNEDTIISIQGHGRQLTLQGSAKQGECGSKKIRILYSLLKTVFITETTCAFLSVGQELGSEDFVVVLSSSLQSYASSSLSIVVHVAGRPGYVLQGLVAIYTRLLAHNILAKAIRGTYMVVLDPADSLATILSKLALEYGIQLLFLTSTKKSGSKSWTYVHPRATNLSLQRCLPENTSVFVDMGESSESSALVQNCLPPMCAKFGASGLFGSSARIDGSTIGIQRMSKFIHSIWNDFLSDDIHEVRTDWIPELNLDDIARGLPPLETQRVISWLATSTTRINVQPASQEVIFAGNKTYWLVGLTGSLGLSICEWMAKRGAKHIALASRSPNIDSEWVELMLTRNCSVQIFSSDITCRGSVRKVYNKIIESMPPIAGVAQGAMVLHDSLLLDLDSTKFEKVTRPKVDGSRYLDEIFSHKNPLDFFVFFSSIAYVAGNVGQSAYAAANAFMASLAINRRSRGLAGSVIHIGAVVGTGYVSRELTSEKQMWLHKAGFSFISEQTFHEIFAEGILASRPGSLESPEFCTGLRLEVDEDREDGRTWASNPVFQHLISRTDNATVTKSRVVTSEKIKTLLQEAIYEEEVFEILKDGVFTKLRAALQLDPKMPIIDIRLEDMGIDSLVSVDIQTWLRKEMGIEMTTLQIRNASTIHELLCCIKELLPPEMVPRLTSGGMSKDETQKSTESGQIGPYSPNISSPGSQEERGVTSPTTPSTTTNDSISFEGSGRKIIERASAFPPSVPSPREAANVTKSPVRSPTFERSIEMSFAQKRFWFLQSILNDKSTFNVVSTVRLTGQIDTNLFCKAFADVCQQHEALRTVFYTDETTGRHMQGVLPMSALTVEYETIDCEDKFTKAVQGMEHHVFDLSRGESLRLKLLSISREKHYIIMGYHHISLDGTSFQIFFTDLDRAYRGLLGPSDQLMLQYPDFSLRQFQEYEQGIWSNELDYWRRYLKDIPPALPLLSGLSRMSARPAIATYNSSTVSFRVDKRLQSQIVECCQHFAINPFHFYLSVFHILLFRYTADAAEKMCIGVANGNRKDGDVLKSLGLFLNLIPIRLSTTSNQMFSHMVRQVKESCDNAFTHSRVPFDILLHELDIPRDTTHSPLFQAFFNYRQGVQETQALFGCKADGELISGGRNPYDISLDITDSASRENLIKLSVNGDLYTAGDATILQQSYIALLEGFSWNPATQITRAQLHLPQAIEKATQHGRGSECPSQWPDTLIERIDNMIETYATKTALIDGAQRSFTYREMKNRVNQIAMALQSQELECESRVGIFQVPGVERVCSLFAVLRIGATCVPLDFHVGLDRLLLMIDDCQPRIILADSVTISEDNFLKATKAHVIDLSQLLDCEIRSAVSNRATPSANAIINYTSGTTGIPKGIITSHASYRNFVEFAPPKWGIEEGKAVILQQSSLGFDMSICQILVCAAYGGTLVVPSSNLRGDAAAMCNLILSAGITHTIATPTEYHAWFRSDPESLARSQWKGAISGGEPISDSLIRLFKGLCKPNLSLVNCYGPTEVTFGCAHSLVPYHQNQSPPQGLSPIQNYSICIVDEKMNPLPVGVAGQIAIGGAGVAKGFLHHTEHDTTFVVDRRASPFLKTHGWTTLHLSGDRGRLIPNGLLVLEGRIADGTQIKIGGIRVDLQEIERTIINTIPSIHHVIVSPRRSSHSDIQFLVAFATLSPEAPRADLPNIMMDLPQNLPLPLYMRPRIAIAIDDIPMTISGKIDRAAIDLLQIPGDTAFAKEESISTLNKMEEAMLCFWNEVIPHDILRRKKITSNTDFFNVGGDSLSLMNLQILIKSRIGTTIPIHWLFEAITLGQMAKALHGQYDHDLQRDTVVDWKQETKLSTDLDLLEKFQRKVRQDHSEMTVVLTGSTGFLGKEILRHLVKRDEVARVYCIAIRGTDELSQLFTQSKVVVRPGNLSETNLGLSSEDASIIFKEADVVIHAGADTSFTKTYSSLKLVNVMSTRELVRLSLPHRLPFHYVSSATVARLSRHEVFGPYSVTAYTSDLSTVDGYMASKWVSEAYLEQVSNQYGLPVVVHRPSSITGEGARESDLLSSVMKFTRQTNLVPDLSSWRGYFDFVSVETTAKEIVREAIERGTQARQNIRYIYESGELEVAIENFHLVMKLGSPSVKVVSAMEWLDAAIEVGLNPLLAMYLRQIVGQSILFPKLEKEEKGMLL